MINGHLKLVSNHLCKYTTGSWCDFMLTVLLLCNREFPLITNINYKLRVIMTIAINLIIMKSNLHEDMDHIYI